MHLRQLQKAPREGSLLEIVKNTDFCMEGPLGELFGGVPTAWASSPLKISGGQSYMWTWLKHSKWAKMTRNNIFWPSPKKRSLKIRDRTMVPWATYLKMTPRTRISLKKSRFLLHTGVLGMKLKTTYWNFGTSILKSPFPFSQVFTQICGISSCEAVIKTIKRIVIAQPLIAISQMTVFRALDMPMDTIRISMNVE